MLERIPATPFVPLIDPDEADRIARERAATFRSRHTALVDAYRKWKTRHDNGIADDEVQGKTAQLVRQMNALVTRTTEDRDAIAAPVTQALAYIKDAFQPFATALEAPIREMRTAIQTYATAKGEAEQVRRLEAAAKTAARAEVAAERAAETGDDLDIIALLRAEMHAGKAEDRASASLSELSRTTGDYGVQAAVRTHWKWQVEDLDRVPREWLAIDTAKVAAEFRRLTEGGRCTMSISGIRVFQDTTLTVRG